jgi:hypothetical protein
LDASTDHDHPRFGENGRVSNEFSAADLARYDGVVRSIRARYAKLGISAAIPEFSPFFDGLRTRFHQEAELRRLAEEAGRREWIVGVKVRLGLVTVDDLTPYDLTATPKSYAFLSPGWAERFKALTPREPEYCSICENFPCTGNHREDAES